MLDRPVDDDASRGGGEDAGDGKPGGEGPRRTGLLLCSLSRPAQPFSPDMIETATGGQWLPLPDVQPQAVAGAVMAALRQSGSRALMLLTHEGAIADFTLQLRAVRRRNGSRSKAAAPVTSPSIVRAPTPAAEILRALQGTDHEARTLQDEPEDDSSEILHSVLLAMDELSEMPGVVLLRLRAGLAEESLVSGLSSVAEVMTRRSPLQSLRASA
ncbi:MAG: hypothetical protein ACK4E3_11275 [Brevundimonas sp.]|uniref:hypothetical protein n=1 Tax=Brevundimonas sp. TaxID=1871086 RepID=UPI00391DB582